MKKIWQFLVSAWVELKRVKWPTFSQAVRYTVTVLTVIVFFGAFSYLVQLVISAIVAGLGGS